MANKFVMKIPADGSPNVVWRNYGEGNSKHLVVPNKVSDDWSTIQLTMTMVWDTAQYEIYTLDETYQGEHLWNDCVDYYFKNK